MKSTTQKTQSERIEALQRGDSVQIVEKINYVSFSASMPSTSNVHKFTATFKERVFDERRQEERVLVDRAGLLSTHPYNEVKF